MCLGMDEIATFVLAATVTAASFVLLGNATGNADSL